MFKNVKSDIPQVFIILVIVWGIQGHLERSDHPSVKHVLSSPERISNSDEHDIRTARAQESLVHDYVSRINNPTINYKGNSNSGQDFIFPTEGRITNQSKLKRFPVTMCENTTFCENPPNYPKDFIKMVIKTRQDLKILAAVDEAPEIGQRIDGTKTDNDTREEPLCASESITILPKSAKNKNNEWLHVINEDNFSQGVKIESCKSHNSACRIIGNSENYETFCKQKFAYRKLAVVWSNGTVGADFVSFPSSCCCHARLIVNYSETRIGIDISASTSFSLADQTSETEKK